MAPFWTGFATAAAEDEPLERARRQSDPLRRSRAEECVDEGEGEFQLTSQAKWAPSAHASGLLWQDLPTIRRTTEAEAEAERESELAGVS